MNAKADIVAEIVPLRALRDNYIWALHEGNACVVVDPGEAGPVLQHLAAHGLTLTAILITHRHPDHVGGVAGIVAQHPVPVFGPASIPCVTHPVAEGDTPSVPGLGRRFGIWFIPGHTEEHIAWLSDGLLFCGDTLFSAGCGRLLGGTAAQLHASLMRLRTLPPQTQVYCAHEYTLSNLRFAEAVEPDNPERTAYQAHCEALRAEDRPTLPSTIATECAINPFLRCDVEAVARAVEAGTGAPMAGSEAVFTALRQWKDRF
ncbi:hydroxyacylglutathione hydrolase [Uliginosibacterium sp. H1]|uniref:hydroxyacylglutathione hydrolase n=1 Tax=Uliginosibacterium sp. H1 TaxID=3114757 RepID=UPI002E18F215|nr:hydroxyacylglutathione hydrolase [Uliginosibacterium sp. H1]